MGEIDRRISAAKGSASSLSCFKWEANMGRKVNEVKGNGELYGYSVGCPACSEAGFGPVHIFALKMGNGSPGWTFDGNFESPTFSPSMLAKCNDKDGVVHVCHSFVRNGKIEYLSDCTHPMAGQTIELPERDW